MQFSPFISRISAPVLALLPAAAGAVTMPGFDHAIPVEPQKLEIGGGAAGGDDLITALALLRIGLLDDLDLGVRAGFVDGLAGQSGFEVQAGPRFRFLRTEDSGFVDSAFIVDASIAKTENLFVLGLDPTFVASHHFDLDGKRELYISMGLGVAFNLLDQDPTGMDLESGFMGAFSVGADIVEHVRASLEARLRDEIVRYGLAVTYLF